jgi:hypothetical protein
LHDDNDGRRGCDRRDGVHDDAELAVIGIAFARVNVCNLSDCECGQQDEAQNSNRRQKAALGAAFAAENCAKSRQAMEPSSSILQKAHRSLDALGMERLPFSNDFRATRGKTGIGRERLN